MDASSGSSTTQDLRVPTRLIAIVTVVAVVVFLRMSRTVTLPFAAGLFIAAVAWPLQRWLNRHIPRRLAFLLTIIAVVLVLAIVIAALGWSVATVADALMERQDQLAALRQRLSRFVQQFGMSLPSSLWPPGAGAAPGTGEGAGGQGAGAAGAVSSMAQRVGSALFSGGGHLALAVGFTALALAEYRDARSRVIARFSHDRAGEMFDLAGNVASTFRRYIFAKTLTSAIAGAASALLAFAVGLDLALIWGFSAFLLEYVPTVGSMLAVIPPALFAFIQFDGLATPLAIVAAFTVLQLVLGNYVDPRIEGRLMSISALVVLLSIVFWAWVWGAGGALLGVPMTVALAVVARHFRGTRWIWALLTEPRDDDDDGEDDESAPRPDDEDRSAGSGPHRSGVTRTRAERPA